MWRRGLLRGRRGTFGTSGLDLRGRRGAFCTTIDVRGSDEVGLMWRRGLLRGRRGTCIVCLYACIMLLLARGRVLSDLQFEALVRFD